MSNKEVIILGAGGHTRSLIPLIEHNNYIIKGVYDDSYNESLKEEISGYPVLGKLSDLKDYKKIIISFGDPLKRQKIFSLYSDHVLGENLIHPSVLIEKKSLLGVSNQVFANAFINSGVEIQKNNIINTGAIIEHEVRIGNHNHISIGTIIAGRVSIGDLCYIGAGATIIDKIKICNNVIVGANAVVVNDIDSPGTYVGQPAKKIK
jgi:sugar O-acyltransferase (sialic acid O-acetyltransferase NeuD family)